MKFAVLLVGVSSVFLCQAALPLPPYIKPCARSDPDFNKCALEHAKEAIPIIVKGDRKYEIPILDPLVVKEVVLTNGGTKAASLTLALKDVKGYGLKDCEVNKLEYDFDKKHNIHELTIPKLVVIGQYTVSGNILLLPISGNGDINITLVNCKIRYEEDYTFKSIDGNRHMELQTPKTTTEVERIHFDFSNLFNGDPALNKKMNAFMNEHWRDVYNELAPSMFKAWSQIILTMFTGLYKLVPFDVIFPENLPK